jgi:hypothetical protein
LSDADLRRAKERYRQAKFDARRQAFTNLTAAFNATFRLTEWSRSAEEAYERQWIASGATRSTNFDWPEIFRRYRNEPDALDLVVWGPDDRLSALALATKTGSAISVDGIEGDPRPDCPLKGKRAVIVLEAAACYGQGLGRSELRLVPLNDAVAKHYAEVCGFKAFTPKGGEPYYRRRI